MKISIITSTYNSAGTIRNTLDSIASQTFPDVEHIIVDGLSVDNTLDVVAQYPHVSQVISEKDKGIYDAMNKGIMHATGDIIGILNSDDFYTYSEVIEDIHGLIITSGADYVYADLNYVDKLDTSRIVRKWRSGMFTASSFRNGWMPPHPTFFVRKDIYDRYGRFNLDMGTAADYELMLRFIVRHQCRGAYLPKIIINMRTGGASNHSISARWKAHKMDRKAWQINHLTPGPFTFLLKPMRKTWQYL